MRREDLIQIFFFALLLFVLYELYLVFSPFFRAILWAGIIAYIFYPVYHRFHKRVGLPPTGAALTTTLIALLVVIPFFTFLLFSITTQAVEFFGLMRRSIESGALVAQLEKLRSLPIVDQTLNALIEPETLKQKGGEWLLKTLEKMIRYATRQIPWATKNLFLLILNFFLTVLLLFFFLRDGGKYYRSLFEVIPLKARDKETIFRKVNETFSAVIRGQFVNAIAQGTLAGIVFWILKIPLPLFLGFLTFLTSLIPLTGSSTVWLPVALYLLFTGSTAKGVALLVAGFLLIGLIDNFLKPILIGEKTKLPPLLLFLGILGGMKVYGLIGLFFGPVLLTLLFALARIYREEYVSR